MDLEFHCDKMPVGRLMNVEDYPTRANRYRYMPYRGPGHLRMQETCRTLGQAHCVYVGPAGEVEFVVKLTRDQGVIETEQFRPVSRTGDPEP